MGYLVKNILLSYKCNFIHYLLIIYVCKLIRQITDSIQRLKIKFFFNFKVFVKPWNLIFKINLIFSFVNIRKKKVLKLLSQICKFHVNYECNYNFNIEKHFHINIINIFNVVQTRSHWKNVTYRIENKIKSCHRSCFSDSNEMKCDSQEKIWLETPKGNCVFSEFSIFPYSM